MNEDFSFFKDLLNGTKDVDIFNNMDPIESKVKFTDRINQQVALQPQPHPPTLPNPTSDLTIEDFDALNQIMNEIDELKSDQIMPVVEPNTLTGAGGQQKQSMFNRMDSMNMALGDFFLEELDVFESNVQMSSDPMFCNNNPLKMIF